MRSSFMLAHQYKISAGARGSSRWLRCGSLRWGRAGGAKGHPGGSFFSYTTIGHKYGVPSGNLLRSYRKSPFLGGYINCKLPFSIAMLIHQRVNMLGFRWTRFPWGSEIWGFYVFFENGEIVEMSSCLWTFLRLNCSTEYRIQLLLLHYIRFHGIASRFRRLDQVGVVSAMFHAYCYPVVRRELRS